MLLPLVGAAFIATLRGDDKTTQSNARWAALGTAIVTFLFSLVVCSKIDFSSSAFQLVEEHRWFGDGPRL